MITLLAALVLMQPETKPAAAPPSAAPPVAKTLVPFPHPLMTEVLYAVPSRDNGDANKDGKRDAAGDEFIELVNPHDKPIQLSGYILADRDLAAGEKKTNSIHFTFPALELKPGEVVVVFNGHGQTWTGPVGDALKAPEKGNDLFSNARVFTMGITSEKQGLANKGDCVQLIAPDAKVIHCIHWGDAKPTASAALIEEAPLVTSQSVQRTSLTGKLESHPTDDKGLRFSPGKWPLNAETAKQPEAPAESTPKLDPKPDQKPAGK